MNPTITYDANGMPRKDARFSLYELIGIIRGDLKYALHEFLSGAPIAMTKNEEIIMPILESAYTKISKHYALNRFDLIVHDAVEAEHNLNMLGIAA